MPMDLSAWNPVDHPRDRHGRFRDKWGLSDRAKRILARVLSGMNARGGPMTFRNDAHVQSYLDQQATRRNRRWSKQQQASLDYYLTPATEDHEAGWADIAASLRAGHTAEPQIRHMDSMMEPLEHDMILTRVMGADAFGLQPQQTEDVEEWTGKLITDQAYMPMNAGTPYPVQGPHVTLSVLTPAGTKAIIPGGNDRTVIVDRSQPLRITHVVRDGQGGVYVYAVATPNQKTGEPPRALGRALSPREISPATPATPEEMARRGLTPEGTPDPNAPAPPTPDQQEAQRAERFARPNAPTPTVMQHGRPPREEGATPQQRDTAQLAERVSNAVADGRDLDAQRRGALEYVENAPRGEDARENRAIDRLAGRIRRAKDREGIMAALDEFTEERGLRRTGHEPGDVVDFNPDTMEPLSRRNVVVGDPVRVISSGYEVDGEVISRQRVTIDSDTDKATLRRLRQERAQRAGRVAEPDANAPAPSTEAPGNAPEGEAQAPRNRTLRDIPQAADVPPSENRAPSTPRRRAIDLEEMTPGEIVQGVANGQVTRPDARRVLEERRDRLTNDKKEEIEATERALDLLSVGPRERAPEPAPVKKAAPAAPEVNAPEVNAPEAPRKAAAAAPDSDRDVVDISEINVGDTVYVRGVGRRRVADIRDENGEAVLVDGQGRELNPPGDSMITRVRRGTAPATPRKRAAKKATAPAAKPAAPSAPPGERRTDYENMRVPELRAEAQRRGLPATSRSRRAELIDMLKGGGERDTNAPPVKKAAKRAAKKATPTAPRRSSVRPSDETLARTREETADSHIRVTMDRMQDRISRAIEGEASPGAHLVPLRAELDALRITPNADFDRFTWHRGAAGEVDLIPDANPTDSDPDMRRAQRLAYFTRELANISRSSDSPEDKLARVRDLRRKMGRDLGRPPGKGMSPEATRLRNEADEMDRQASDRITSNATQAERLRLHEAATKRRAQADALEAPVTPVKKAAKAAKKVAKAAPATPANPYEGQRVSQLRKEATRRGIYVPSATRREGIVALLEQNDRGVRTPTREDIDRDRRIAREQERRERARAAARVLDEQRRALREAREAAEAAAEEERMARLDEQERAEASLNHPDGLGQLDTPHLRSLAGEFDIPDAQDLDREALLERLRATGAVAPGTSRDVSLTRVQLARMSTPQLRTLAVQRNINTTELHGREDYIAALASRYRSDSAPDLTSLATQINDILADTTRGWQENHRMARELVAQHIDGDYAGLRVQVSEVTGASGSGGFNFSALIFSPDGRQVGTTRRQIHLAGVDHMGRPTEAYVYNAYLQIASAHQGSGFAEEWNNNLFAWYKRSGITKVKVSANIDVGGYTWATKGFDFADARTASGMFDNLEAALDGYEANPTASLRRKLFGSSVTNEEIARQIALARELIARHHANAFGTPDYPTAFHMSQIGRKPSQRGPRSKRARWLGKGFMLGSGWSGILHL